MDLYTSPSLIMVERTICNVKSIALNDRLVNKDLCLEVN